MFSPLVPLPMVVDFQPSGVWDGAGRVHETPGSWPDLGPEAYRLTVTSQGAAVEAGGPAGLFYAHRTLDQLRFHHTVGGRTAIPAQTITDGPRWPHRGLMVDVARHWFPAPEIRRLLELMSHLKLNVFHWHLTDDQGWRLPVPGWPRLNEGVPAYTEEEIRGVVQFAADRHITVIPEVDLPGHFSAALAAYPELGCTKKPVRRASGPGIYFDIACAGSDRTMAFLEDVVASVCDLFPGPRVHLGGDEAPKLRWKGCPDCQARIEREGLAGEEELQGWLTNRLAAHLEARGKQAVVWTESVYSGRLDPSVLVHHWNEMPDRGRAALWANGGGATVVSQVRHHYLDYPFSMTPLSRSYEDPTWLAGLTDRGRAGVEGIEAALWTEFVPDRPTADARLFPRLAAVAERAWTPPESCGWAGFGQRYEGWARWFTSLGVTVPGMEESNPDPKSLLSRWRTFAHMMRFFGNPRVLAGIVQLLFSMAKKA